MIPPKPPSRPDRVSLWRYTKLFRQDILSAQPARLYRAWMAEFRTPFFRSYLMNQPDLVKTVLKDRPDDGYFAICVGGLESGHASTAPDVVV